MMCYGHLSHELFFLGCGGRGEWVWSTPVGSLPVSGTKGFTFSLLVEGGRVSLRGFAPFLLLDATGTNSRLVLQSSVVNL